MRLIDADKLIEVLNKKRVPFNADVNGAILTAPTVDAVDRELYEQCKFDKDIAEEQLKKIVRCKDCKIAQNNRYNSRVDGKCSILCEHVTTEDGRYELKVFRNANDYCSYGERREE